MNNASVGIASRIFRILIVLSVFGFSCSNHTSDNVIHPSGSTSRTIAILPVSTDQTNDNSVRKALRDYIEIEFSTYPEYCIVERVNVDKVLNEIAFSNSGIISENMNKFGRLLNCDFLLISTFNKVNSIWILSGKIVEVDNGIVLKSAMGKVSSVELIDAAAKGMSRRITGRIN
jgi:hypothetical protein